MKLNKLLQLLRDNARAETDVPRVRVESSDTEHHVYVYDVIDAWWGASAKALIEAMSGAGDRTVHLHINSPGGDVFEARAMASAIVAHPGAVVAHIDGLAASAATYLALSANEVRMTQGGMFMIHNAWTLAWGNKTELRSTADLLDKIDQNLAADYARKTKMGVAQVLELMAAETWYTADEALEAGFVDAVDPNSKAASAQAWDLSAYNNAPKPVDPPDPAQIDAQVTQLLQANRNRLRMLTTV